MRISLNRDKLFSALKTARRGAAADLAGMRTEHLHVLLEEEGIWEKFGDMLESYVNASVSEEVAAALSLGCMTALQKANG